MKLTTLAILLLVCCNSFSQYRSKILFKETQVDTISNKLDSILLIGIGLSTTRLFLDDVSEFLITALNKDSISAHYHYLGKTSEEARPAFDTINKQGYKAILFFLPKGASFDVGGNISRMSTTTRLGTFSPTIATAGILYAEEFSVQLCLPGTDRKKIWTASVEVSCDPGKSNTAKKLATKLLSCFKANNYLR